MGKRVYSLWLNETSFLAVEFATFEGRVVSFVVRLMLVEDSKTWCVARYDTAHGCPHLDLVNRRGRLLEKRWLLGMGFAEALRFAIADFKENHASYIKNFQ